MARPANIPRVLSIAGSDSGGGAGIQADLKAFAACGVHGMTAVTAITAQNTIGVTAIHQVPAEVILAQVRAVVADIGVDAVKVGMLGTVASIDAVAEALAEIRGEVPVVIDPVMVSESGSVLLEPAARAALIERLLPRATVLTPNLPEAAALVGGAAIDWPGEPRPAEPAVADGRVGEAEDFGEAERLVRAVHGLGPRFVVLTGGHRRLATDLFDDGETVTEIPGERFADGAAHGSGCTHSSVLAARLAHGDEPLTAARTAKAMAARAVAEGLDRLGAGTGPVNVLRLGVGGES